MKPLVRVLNIWFTNGSTAQFEHVRDIHYSGGQIHFEYIGVSHGAAKKASFLVENVAGYAVGDVTEDKLKESKEARAHYGYSRAQGDTTSDVRGTNHQEQQKQNRSSNGTSNR